MRTTEVGTGAGVLLGSAVSSTSATQRYAEPEYLFVSSQFVFEPQKESGIIEEDEIEVEKEDELKIYRKLLE